ncbi:MAG: hypothetical protein IKB54_05925 [Clostridia bacterium]|nr:hypothetical protein [Clostridia bacterium]
MKKTISVISLVLVLVILTACLVGCAPANENKAKAKLEKKGYTVEIMSGEEMNEVLQQYAGMPLNFGAKGMMSATKGMDEIAAIWFETKEKAENYKSIMDFAMDAVGGQMGQIDFIYGVKGKVFYMGTEQGVKDFF